jgi:hypothetical protein
MGTTILTNGQLDLASDAANEISEGSRAAVRLAQGIKASSEFSKIATVLAMERKLWQSAVKPILEMQRHHEEVMRKAVAPIFEMQRLRDQLARDAIQPILEMQRVHDAVRRAAVARAVELQRARDEMTRAALAPIVEFQKRMQLISETFAQTLRPFLEAQKQIASAVARMRQFDVQAQQAALAFSEIGRLTQNLSHVAENANELSRVTNVSLEHSIEQVRISNESRSEAEQVRDSVFAFLAGENFLAERVIVNRELATHPEFDQLGLPQKIDLLLRIGRENRDIAQDNQELIRQGQSSKLMVYCVAIAIELLANYFVQIPGLVPWVFVLIVMAADFLSPKQRIANARRLIRSAHISAPNKRLVTHRCGVFSSTRKNARTIGRLHAGLVVDVSAKVGGWQEVSYYQDGKSCVGWVRSKYLRQL